MRHFYWLPGGQLAGLPCPGSSAELRADLRWLVGQGVSVLVSLTEQSLPKTALDEAGLHGVHLPIPDFNAPTGEQLASFISEVEGALAGGQSVGVHCRAGLGRTGTMLAVWLVHRGMSADEAIGLVRQQRPDSIETPEQVAAIEDFAAGIGVCSAGEASEDPARRLDRP